MLFTVYLRTLQVHSGYTLAIHHPDLHFCMTPYYLNLLKRHTSWSGARQRPARSLGRTSRLPGRSMLSCTPSCMLRGRYVVPCSPVRKAAGRDDVPISSKQNVWYYLGERRWTLADIKTLWDSLGPVLVHPFLLPAPEYSRCYVSLRPNTLLHARPILSRYHTGLKGESLSNSP